MINRNTIGMTLMLLALSSCSQAPEYPIQTPEALCEGTQILTLPSGRMIETYQQCGETLIAINTIGENDELGAGSKIIIAPQLDDVTFLDENGKPIIGSMYKLYELHIHPDLNDCEVDWIVYKELALHAIAIDIIRHLGIIDYTFEVFPPEEYEGKASRVVVGLADTIATELLVEEFSKVAILNPQCIRLKLNIQDIKSILGGNSLRRFMLDGTLTNEEFTTLLNGYIRLTDEYTNDAFKDDLIDLRDAIEDN